MVMGCYGIGVTRIAAAAIEQNHDDDGIKWPMALAPFHVVITTAGREPELAAAAETLEKELEARGVEVLYDDRDERPGAKFKDADLIGVPLRVTVGKRGVGEASSSSRSAGQGGDDGGCEYDRRRVGATDQGAGRLSRERLIVALDHSSAKAALAQVDDLGDAVERYKVGLELFVAEGRPLIDELHERDKRVFLDLKLHDIPETVRRAARWRRRWASSC